jgi:hypothetical protein
MKYRKWTLALAATFVVAACNDSSDANSLLGDLAEKSVDLYAPPTPAVQNDPTAEENSCLDCHRGIEMIRGADSGMMRAIFEVARKSGSANRCVACHGGNPESGWDGKLAPGEEKYVAATAAAHSGTPAWFNENPGPKTFYPDPGSPWINEHTCGACHGWQVEAQWRSLMMTEAGKIQGTAWGFGALEGYDHKWANYDVDNPDHPGDVVGTEVFRAYLLDLAKREPQVFVEAMEQLPEAPTAEQVAASPQLAAFTYLRGECQRCHLAVRGKQRYGDFRGMGCSACHIPYSNHGQYEGSDQSANKEQSGHPLVHSIQATREAPVTRGKVTYSGIPVETCTACHNRGRRIGVSFQGLMETAYASPWTAAGEPQQKLHGKNYIKLHEDLHKSKGFLCQDCHTTIDAHSPNRLIGSIAGAVEIECTDCHGTPGSLPWELPLGYGDEYRERAASGEPRGLATSLPAYMEQGETVAPEEGYLLSARGNPLGNVVRQGDKVKVHLASGRTRVLEPLKMKTEGDRLSLEARVAMVDIGSHIDRMECYACHATWAPQCYGCHIKVDYRKPAAHVDWIALGENHNDNGMTGEGTDQETPLKIDGEIKEGRSYLRWEDPALAINGEGRVAPVVPGCQTSVTVLDSDGNALQSNHIYRIPDVEGAGKEGQLGIDHSPLHPHTVQKRARTCDSCHASDKALGYGIAGGILYDDPSKEHTVDLTTGEGQVIPDHTSPQMTAMDGLVADWSRFVDETGKQLQTVGHHFRLSRPLNNEERGRIDRQGVCLGCHQEIPDGSLATGLLHHVAEAGGLLPKTDAEHTGLLHKIARLAAWTQVLAPFILLLILFLIWRLRKRRKANSWIGTK